MNKPQRFFIAQVGKTHGLHGDLKFHIHTDFPEQFKAGYSFQSSAGLLEIHEVNLTRGIISFKGYSGIDYARKLTNTKLYASLEETKERCELKEDEHFWFEIEACSVMEEDVLLGKISEIQRLADVDYLFIKTDAKLVEEGFATTFLVPYIDRYIVKKDIEIKIIFTKDAKEILEAS
jgi:16S rRNA processing protein RimM